MKIAQIKSMLQRQTSTHQSTLCVLEAVIEYLAEKESALESNAPERVPAADATQVAPVSTETAEAPAPPKAKVRRAAVVQEK